MGNMGYCRFINTLRDLQDCQNNMDRNLSYNEELARKNLVKLCQDVAGDYGDTYGYEAE